MTYLNARRKLFFERIGMFPFVLLGRVLGYLFPLKTKHGIFLLFPNADMGGSAINNLDLIDCFKDKDPLVIFCKRPRNDLFIERYKLKGVKLLDLSKLIDYKIYHFVNFIYRGIIATWIKQQKADLFSGECMYFYKIIPHVKKETRCIELSHLNTWMGYNIGFIDRINARVFSTEKLKQFVEQQYKDNHLAEHYFKKLHFIDNAIDIPEYKENNNAILQVYFIGRGAAQKRIYLIAAIAKKLHEKQLPVNFNFVGDVEKIINPVDFPFCTFHGSVKDDTVMNQLCQQADVLLLTSSYEGLPMVVIQMMANAKPVIATAVNGIPDYITHMENGLLISATKEEDIINEGAAFVELLLQNKALRIEMGMKNRKIAIERFSKELFNRSYQYLLSKN